MKIIDAHCHVFPDSLAERASTNTGKFYGYTPYSDGRLDTLMALGGEAGISHYVICSVATNPRQVMAVNRHLLDTAANHPGQITAIGTLHPHSPRLREEAEELIRLGRKGVKLHPDIQQIEVDDPGMMEVFALCEGRLPVLCHIGDNRYDYSSPTRIMRVLDRFPKLRLIGAHLGGWSMWRQAAELLHGYDGMMVDCSSSLAFLPPEEAAAIIRLYGPERVMFGTDYPMWVPREEVRLFNGLPLADDERRLILHDNAAALLGIE